MTRCRSIFRIALLAVVAAGARVQGAEDDHLEERVRAAFVYNFVRFTEWPAAAFGGPREPVVVGVVGGGAIYQEIVDAMRGKSVGERAVKVQPFAPDQVGTCHVLYVAAGVGAAGEILKKVGGLPVLTVGETGDFIEGVGVVRLYLEEGKQRFEVNVAAAERAKLQMSSKLLKLARTVRK